MILELSEESRTNIELIKVVAELRLQLEQNELEYGEYLSLRHSICNCNFWLYQDGESFVEFLEIMKEIGEYMDVIEKD